MTLKSMQGHRYLPSEVISAVLLVGLVRPMIAGTDANAGSWQMIVLSGPTQISVAAPSPVTDAAYQAELAAIKSAQPNITGQQRQAVDYWNKGGVLGWNQILLG